MLKVSRVALALTVWVGLVAPSVGQNAGSSKPREPVAVIGGETIYDDDLSSVASQLQQLRKQEYDLKLNAIESLLFQKLLESESKKVGVSSQQLLEREADSKVSEPTDSEVEAYYLGQKDRLKRPLEEIKTQIRQILKQGKLQQARQEYFKRL